MRNNINKNSSKAMKPNGFKVFKLGELFQRRQEKGKSGLPTLSVTINNGLIHRDSIERKTDTNLLAENHLLVKPRDIAYNMMRMWQGAFGVAEIEGIVSPAYIVCCPNPQIDSQFAGYLLKTAIMLYRLKAYSYGITSDRLRLYYKDFAKIPVSIPYIQEQKKIAEILGCWDSGIERLEKLIDAKRKMKKGLMQQLLTGKKRFKEFKGKKWREVQLGEIFKQRGECGYAHLPLLAITSANGVMERGNLELKDNSSSDKSKYNRICPNDIGYNTMRMWQGISGVSELEGIVSPAYTICIPDKTQVYPKFMGYLFKYHPVIFLFYRHSQGMVSDTWNLKFRHFSEIKITIPCLDEQQKIASVLNSVDQEIGHLCDKLEALKNQKKGLMQKLLIGKIRVKV